MMLFSPIQEEIFGHGDDKFQVLNKSNIYLNKYDLMHVKFYYIDERESMVNEIQWVWMPHLLCS